MQTNRRHIGLLVRDRVFSAFASYMRRQSRDFPEFSGMVVPIDDLIGIRVFSTGAFERTQFDAIGSLLDDPEPYIGRTISPDSVFIDVGANIGLYTVRFASRFAQTIAIEANPTTFKILQANLALKDLGSVHAVCEGASSRSGEATIYVPVNGNLGWATLQKDHHRASVSVREQSVRLRKLDDIAAEHATLPIGVIKIDVEGHELEVLQGAQRILAESAPVIFFECLNAKNGREILALLQEQGYADFFTFERRWKRPEAGAMDYSSSFFSGLPVVAERVSAENISHSALICAVKHPERARVSPPTQ